MNQLEGYTSLEYYNVKIVGGHRDVAEAQLIINRVQITITIRISVIFNYFVKLTY